MIYEYDAFIKVPDKLGEDKMAELDCAIAYFVEDEFGYPVEFSVLGQVDEKSGDCEIEKVVRCKDCKYAEEEKTEHPYGVLCNHATVGGYGDVFDFMHYCSYGERKDE